MCGKWTVLEKLLDQWRAKPEEENKVLIFSKSVKVSGPFSREYHAFNQLKRTASFSSSWSLSFLKVCSDQIWCLLIGPDLLRTEYGRDKLCYLDGKTKSEDSE